MRVLDKEKGCEMYLSTGLTKNERNRFNYEHYWACNFSRGFKAASARLFQLNPIELVAISELFAAKVEEAELEYGGWFNEENAYVALIDAVEVCCDEHTFVAVLTAGQAALINESEPSVWTRPEPVDRKKKRQGRKPQAYQDHYDEKSFWSWRGHKTSKCWKDQSKRKRQWR